MISIITPVLNGVRFIEGCIQNVIEQGCEDLEHIIVDGASGDGTQNIVERYAESYSHIRWLSEPDRGQSDAMNKGLTMARGGIVGFLNVDDYYEPGVFLRILELFAPLQEPALLVGNCIVRDAQGAVQYVSRPTALTFEDILQGPERRMFPINPSSYFCHRSLFDRIGMFDVCDHHSMDLDFLLRAVRAAHVRYVDEVWGNFRLIPGTKTHTDAERGMMLPRIHRLLRRHRRRAAVQRVLHALFPS